MKNRGRASAAILVAIGANLPAPDGATPLATCRVAAEAMRGLPGLRLVATSRWYQTSAVPASTDPDYINGMVLLTGYMQPAALLEQLHRLEAARGRMRGAPNAARTLDLDIIAMGDLVRDNPDPVLPHPRAHQRAFVLRPLLDVAPEWVHPRLGVGAAELLGRLPPQGVRPV